MIMQQVVHDVPRTLCWSQSDRPRFPNLRRPVKTSDTRPQGQGHTGPHLEEDDVEPHCIHSFALPR